MDSENRVGGAGGQVGGVGGEGGEDDWGVVRTNNIFRGHPTSGKSNSKGDRTRDTANEAVMAKFRRLVIMGEKVVVCQELLEFFKELERVGTGQG